MGKLRIVPVEMEGLDSDLSTDQVSSTLDDFPGAVIANINVTGLQYEAIETGGINQLAIENCEGLADDLSVSPRNNGEFAILRTSAHARKFLIVEIKQTLKSDDGTVMAYFNFPKVSIDRFVTTMNQFYGDLGAGPANSEVFERELDRIKNRIPMELTSAQETRRTANAGRVTLDNLIKAGLIGRGPAAVKLRQG